MFEEAQLYSPVTQAESGEVKVHLADDHPGVNDPAYRERRNEIAAAALAWEPGQPIPHIDYTEDEQEVWRTVCRELAPKYERYACRAFREGVAALDLLPDPQFAELNRVAGEAARRAETQEGLQMVADVFWFTIEFGVVWEEGELRAYGAGILSSYGEIEEFRGMEIRPIDFEQMATIDYDITKYQPVLFCAESMEHLVEEVGSFFATCDDETAARWGLVGEAAPAGSAGAA